MKETSINKSINFKPDVASEEKVPFPSTLQKVGMENVELPIKIRSQGTLITIPAKCDLFVSLDDPHAKGIHMSRLFLAAQEYFDSNEISPSSIQELLKLLLETHESISYSSFINISFDYPIKRKALKSEKEGWRTYPIILSGKLEKNNLTLDTSFRITYSSTCPCSAALARQIIQEQFLEDFSNGEVTLEKVHDWLGKKESQTATPHSQRSYADITVRFKNSNNPINITCLINMVEAALSTPVQAAVKREDEQEFARLNGSNFMFSEDAGRKIKAILDMVDKISDYKIHAQHIESLHPHDAVVITTKGIPGGFTA